ncbi:ABC transporter ATP-binding protein [Lentzea sp. NPDC051213]|uniref:ABC transporter ATP-binding protein n=1 Tax=Lentzea sp. NPDC051213 TaxID=3364126 RepID=UPI0037AC144B
MTEALASPYWRLDDTGRPLSLWQLIRRFPAACRPVVEVIRLAAPRSAAAIAVLQVASGVTGAFGLLATTGVLEELLTAGPTTQRVTAAVPALVLVIVAYLARGAMDAGVSLATARVVPGVRRVAEERLFDAGLHAELVAFDDDRFYDRMHRARDRGLFYLEQATANVIALLGAVFAVVGAAGIIGVLHPVLLPVLLISLVPEGWAVFRSARLGYEGMTRLVTLNRRLRMISDLATDREPAAEIRACQAEAFVLDEYRQLADALRDHEVAVGLAQARTGIVGRACAGVATAGTFVALGLLLYAGWIPLAVAGTAVIAIRTSSATLRQLVRATNELFEQSLYVSDYQSFLSTARERRRSASVVEAPPAPDRITLREVGFRYPGASVDALSGIDLTIHKGQIIALVGENGSGKTTLAKIIAGLYRPGSGQVCWDGRDISAFDPADVADQLVMVLQDPVRWPHDARTNVRVGRHDRADPGDAALHSAADAARATEVVEGLPHGWKTLLSKYFRDGHELSGGQWQRLAVARGLFRDAPLVIWDEPTAPLDAKAEYAVFESLRQLAGSRTVVLITHRLASVRDADQIYLLHEGSLVERGTHDELLAAGGRYAQLYGLQVEMYTGAAT